MTTDYSDDQNDAAVIHQLSRLAEENVPAITVELNDKRKFLISRNDFVVTQVTLANAADVLQPKTVVQTLRMQTATSLRDYVKRFKNPDTLLFADIGSNTIVAAVDYHKQPLRTNPDDAPAVADNNTLETPTARLNTHNATLALAYSKEWSTWVNSNEKLMTHLKFADFLEENALDLLYPHGADLLELCRDLHVKSGMQFKSSIRMGDTVSVEYQKENDATTKSGLDLPAEMQLSMPVFFGEGNVEVRCLLRRKIDDGQLFLGYKMVRYDNIRQDEFQRIVEAISVDTDTLALYGTK